jgi:hypothetical protein
MWDGLKKEVMSMIFVFMFLALAFFLMANPESRVVSYSFFEQ